jgi:hypothetical protein
VSEVIASINKLQKEKELSHAEGSASNCFGGIFVDYVTNFVGKLKKVQNILISLKRFF